MSRQRRNRDVTGDNVYYDIDEISGAGVFDIMKNVATKVASKLTGKAAKKIATKAAEKLVEKGAEKVGEKTGQLIGEKIYDRFSQSKGEREGVYPLAPRKGDQIIKELQKINQRGKTKNKGELDASRVLERVNPFTVYPLKKSISQQFEELL